MFNTLSRFRIINNKTFFATIIFSLCLTLLTPIHAKANNQDFQTCFQSTTPTVFYEKRYSTIAQTITKAIFNTGFDSMSLITCNTDCTTLLGGSSSQLEEGSQGCAAGFADQLVGKDGRVYESTGGLAYTVNQMAADLYSDQNTFVHLSMFTDDTLNNNLFGQTVYAQSEVDNWFFRVLAFDIWKLIRNLSVSLIAIVVAVVALAIIFRKKLPSQYTVTIFNSIGSIVIAVFFILLSYPIMAIIWSSVNAGFELFAPLFVDLFVGITGIESMKVAVNAENQVTIGRLIRGLLYFENRAEAASGIGTAVSIPLLVGAALAFKFTAFIGTIVAFFLLFKLLIWILVYIIILWRLYFRLIIMTMAAPLVGLVSILPGRQGLVPLFFRKALSELLYSIYLSFVLIFGVGFYYFQTQPNVFWAEGNPSVKVLTLMIPTLFSWYLLFKTGKVRKAINSSLDAQGGLFEAIASGGGGSDSDKRSLRPRT